MECGQSAGLHNPCTVEGRLGRADSVNAHKRMNEGGVLCLSRAVADALSAHGDECFESQFYFYSYTHDYAD